MSVTFCTVFSQPINGEILHQKDKLMAMVSSRSLVNGIMHNHIACYL